MFKVMIVDDEPNIRNGLQYLIDWEELDFTISSLARNGKDAIKKIKESYPDLIITDIKMPIIDGLELIHYVREKLKDKNMSFIILSGYDDFEFAKKAIRYNVVSYLLKPIDEDELINLLKKITAELSYQDNFEFFYNRRVENFSFKFCQIEEMNSLIEAIERKKDTEITNSVNKIFDYFSSEKLHPQIIKIHLDDFFIRITEIINEMSGTIDNIENKERLVEPPMSRLNIIQLKNILLEFSLKAAEYIEELKSYCSNINKVKQYVRKYYYKNLKLKDIAGVFYVNPAYLGQLFKKETGMCFSKFLNETRLENAKKLQ